MLRISYSISAAGASVSAASCLDFFPDLGGFFLHFGLLPGSVGLEGLALGGDVAFQAGDQVAQDRVGDLEVSFKLARQLAGGAHVHQYIVTLGLVIDGVSKTPFAPLVDTLYLAAVVLDDAGKAGDHIGARLIFERGVDDVHHFVIVHLLTSFWTIRP